MSELLRPTCDCGRRVRVLWSGPLSPQSRPFLMVCGYHPNPRCDFRQRIEEHHITKGPAQP